ncbi:RraA family protein [Paenibacillus radicis (ex Xue et al. 2023)]|uniref:Putative 4-hydroxy-4-methyl-2-oxoglutarate aldolase n=1 Tax=Paenibacillus radicis (ex Xue et al. 2023) TaxID=2972489 RepID=A0ABT1YA28_9BACL|nr:RraA family protein [Paenibacillus radicis (ex Xue et al. 2023)]MCR8630033.1 RraA family protein [Paenibacillus radicis (ex Xue et al. 2023)]
MENNIGFRIIPRSQRPDLQLIEQFRNVVTPHLSDNMNRIFASCSQLKPYHAGGRLVGTALTVKTRPGDNLMIHKAIEMALPGEVIVVDGDGDLTNSLIGEIMTRLAEQKGVAGFVLNGAIRDSGAIAGRNFPVYARGITHRGPYKDGPGEINVPVSIGGMIVNPGDIIVGDEDGLVAVPVQHAELILGKARQMQQIEDKIIATLEQGENINRDWIDEFLKQKGCQLNDTNAMN